MAWPRIEDDYLQHPKIRRLPVEGVALDMAGIIYCSRNLTDGLILGTELGAVLPQLARPAKVAALLVQAVRWEVDPEGFRIHDYLVYNPTRASVLTKRAKDSKRKAGEVPRGIHAESEVPHTQYPVPTVVAVEDSQNSQGPEGEDLPASGPSTNGKKPHPARLDNDQYVLLGKILAHRPKWLGRLTPGGIVGLNKEFTFAAVFEAMQELEMRLKEGTAGQVKDPYPYLRGMVSAPLPDSSSSSDRGVR